MSVYSLLPSHILEDIIYYVVKPPLKSIQTGYFFENLALAHICSRWRALTLSAMFSTCELKIGFRISTEYYSSNSIVSFDHLCQHYNRYVRCLELCLGYKEILDGTVASCLLKLEFPRVNSLKVKLEIADYDYSQLEKESSSSAIDALQFKKIAPKISVVDLAIDNLAYRKGISGFGTLFEGIVGDLNVHLNLTETLELNIDNITKVTRLQCNWDDHWQSTLQLIRRNANSLRELNLHCYHTYGLNKLSDNKSYPDLKIISLEASLNMDLIKVPASNAPSPFPLLEYVYINFPYPFEDDVLFRGNIKHLQIYANDHVLNMLCKNTLSIRTLNFLGNTQAKAPSSFSMFGKFMKQTLGSLYGLHVNDRAAAKACYEVMQSQVNGKTYPHMKYLRLHTQLNITRMVNTLACFSHLNTFSAEFQTANVDFRCLDLNHIYFTMRQKINNLNHSLKSLHLNYEQESGYKGMSVLIIILAALCPHLDKIYLNTTANFNLSAVEATLMDPYFKARFAVPEIDLLEFELVNYKFVSTLPRHIVLLRIMRKAQHK